MEFTPSNLVPIGDRVLIKRESLDLGPMDLAPNLERGDHPMHGIIIGVGSIKASLKTKGVKIGAKIVFTKFSPTPYFMGEKEEEVLFVESANILGVIKE